MVEITSSLVFVIINPFLQIIHFTKKPGGDCAARISSLPVLRVVTKCTFRSLVADGVRSGILVNLELVDNSLHTFSRPGDAFSLSSLFGRIDLSTQRNRIVDHIHVDFTL